MELLDARRSVLVVIDYQGRLMELVENKARLVAVAKRLLTLAEMFAVPAVLAEQYPKGIGPTHPGIRAAFDAVTTPKKVPREDDLQLLRPAGLRGAHRLDPPSAGERAPAGRRRRRRGAHLRHADRDRASPRGGPGPRLLGRRERPRSRATRHGRSTGWRRRAPSSRTTSRSVSSGRGTRTTPDSAR